MCYYDIARQGCTNENMKLHPYLHDFSPNHLDMECHNFSWSGMSGIGGYVLDFMEFYPHEGIIKRSNSKIIFENKKDGYTENFYKCGNNPPIGVIHYPECKLMVSGLNGRYIYGTLWGGDNFTKAKQFTIKDGINTIPEHTLNITNSNLGYITYIQFSFKNFIGIFTLEILPNYPGALCFDGIDDYCVSYNQPILNDYTIIAKRERLTNYLVSKCKSGSINTNGAFILEGNSDTWSFGAYTSYGSMDLNKKSPISELITYQTKCNYQKSKTLLNTNPDCVDSDALILGSSVLPKKLDDVHYFKGAFYNLLLFNRTLTEEEINWVKTNIIEGKVIQTENEVTIYPGDYNLWEEPVIGELNITLSDTDNPDEYTLDFTTGYNTIVRFNPPVTWVNDETPYFEPNTRYLISIQNNLAVGGAFKNE